MDKFSSGAAWMTEGVCRSVGYPDLWFPEKGCSPNQAKRLCRSCPVIMECLEWAVYRVEVHGVWGGKSASELVEIRQRLGVLDET